MNYTIIHILPFFKTSFFPLKCYAASLGNQFPTFRRKILPFSLMVLSSFAGLYSTEELLK